MYYKVVTESNQSLGLRNNPSIMYFPINKWVLESTPIFGNCDHGGIWCAQNFSKAKGLAKYMQKKHRIKTKIYSCEIGNILYENSYRVKTDKIRLLEEKTL